MKKKLLLSISIALIAFTSVFCQGFTKPSEGKAVVYVVNIMLGFGKTQIHHNTECIGVLKSKDYLRYECNPGNHLFLGIETANKVFFTANLEANNTYIVQMRRIKKLSGQAPIFKAIDLNKSNKKEKILKIVNNNNPVSSETNLVKKINTKWKKFTEKAITKFEKKLRKKNKHMHISADMTYKN
jgi:hypothetical protein